MASHQEFDALQRALRDPGPKAWGRPRGLRRGAKPIVRWWDEVAERIKATRGRELPRADLTS